MTTAATVTAATGSRTRTYSPAEIAGYVEAFHRDGFVTVPGVLAPEEIVGLKAAIDRVFDEPRYVDSYNSLEGYIALRMFEIDAPLFLPLLTREPLITLAETLLGPDCHIIAQNALRNGPGRAVDTFHVDEGPFFPIDNPEIPRHDARLRMPVFVVNCTYALTDIPSAEYGPTQCVPGSHYAGRAHNDPKNPTFEGRGAESILCKAGDLYLFNNQVWHRGAPNTSDRVRYITGAGFSRRFIAQRFFPFVNYQLPKEVMDIADDRTRRVLGLHARGAYG